MGNELVTTVINNVTGDSIIQDGKYSILKWAYDVLDGAVTITASVSGVTSGWTPTIDGTPSERVLNLDAVYTVTVSNLTPLPIAWSMVAPQYNYAAMDKNGTVWFFQENPPSVFSTRRLKFGAARTTIRIRRLKGLCCILTLKMSCGTAASPRATLNKTMVA